MKKNKIKIKINIYNAKQWKKIINK
jgi:hypothetical protein